MQLCRAPTHIQSAGQDAFVFQALLDAILHRPPQLHQPGADLFFTAPDLFVGHHQFGDAQVVFLAQLQQFNRTGKVVGQLSAIQIDHAAGRLRLIHDKTAAHRIVGVAMQFAVITLGNDSHGIGVEWQVLVDQAHVPCPDKRHRQTTIQ
ncbi:hypothetical protein D3C87_1141460 [compost metagenome]